METKFLRKIVQKGTRMSGNGSFPELNESMIGKEVKVTRNCLTWEGCLGYFETDEKKQTFAFYLDELAEK